VTAEKYYIFSGFMNSVKDILTAARLHKQKKVGNYRVSVIPLRSSFFLLPKERRILSGKSARRQEI
jgi:hypothetical protein